MANLPPFAIVNNEMELNEDLAALAGGMGSYTITLGRGFTLGTDLLAVNLGTGGSLTLQGNGQTIDGGGAYRGFFDYAGVLILDNLTIANAVAIGGSGGTAPTNGAGAGGGGAGLGGGLFVASAGNATLNNVTFTNDKAVGGSGGDIGGGSTEAAGGGGGMGGNGGSARQVKVDGFFVPEDGSGGGIGRSAGGGAASPGGPGIIPTGPATRIGGGGGTGSGRDYFSGDGGVQPGGFGGGGGGGSSGGFGGGGGGGRNGGFGGGGGGGFSTGGFGGGAGGVQKDTAPTTQGAGGGGLGAGADVFVQQGGRLIIGAAAINAGSVAGGGGGSQAGGAGARAPAGGGAFGSGIFLQGNQSITFAPPAGTTTTVSGSIADQDGSIAKSGGVGSVVVNGAGTLDLALAASYTGGTKITGGGTLELAVPTAAGSGNIIFNGKGSLLIDTLVAPTNKIGGFGTNNTIDLAALPFVAGATAVIKGDKLVVTSGVGTVTLDVQSADATLFAQKDASGGTVVSRFAPVVTNEVQLNTELKLLAGSTTAEKITIGASFALTAPLQVINLGAGGALTIDGGGFSLNGQGAQRGLLVYSGNVTIDNLALNNMAAIGGVGGSAANPGGGGAGLGGGLLVAAGGDVTLNGVSFADDRAIGGAGGSYFNGGFAGGGGGGLGGNGGDGFFGGPLDFTTDGGGGGLGLGANGGKQDVNGGQGGAGIAPGSASGGNGSGGTSGGINGGGGGDAPRGDGGGGGIGGQNGNSTGNFGGNGGFGGGGGGGGSGFFDKTQGGGSGGFGGGAGGGANSTHTGGFGGGGAGAGDARGVPGFGGGLGGGSNFGGGGGGAGLGGDVLVQQGGTLTIGSGTLGAGTVAGGAGGTGRTPSNGGNSGGAGGDGIFLQGNQTITFAPASGTTLTIKGVIADENAFNPGAGTGSVVVNGNGTVKLAAGNSYTGGTSFQSGTLELAVNSSGGAGAITFGDSGSAVETLRLDYVKPAAAMVSQAIRLLGAGTSMIYLPDVSPASVSFGSYAGNNLTFKSGATNYTFGSLTTAVGKTINAASIVADKSGTGVDIVASTIASITGESISLGAGMNFLPPVIGGSGSDAITANDGTNTLVAGTGASTVTGGSGASDFVFHAGSGEMTIEDFNVAKGDTLTVDKALQALFSQASDDHGGTMLSFGAGQGGIDLVNHAAISASSIHFI